MGIRRLARWWDCLHWVGAECLYSAVGSSYLRRTTALKIEIVLGRLLRSILEKVV